MQVKRYDPAAEELEILCPGCTHTYIALVGDLSPAFVPEFAEFENPRATCPYCGTVYAININLPIFEESELDEIPGMPAEEITARAAIRELMWRKRLDLKGKNRETERTRFVAQNQRMIEAKRQRGEELRRVLNESRERNESNEPNDQPAPGTGGQ